MKRILFIPFGWVLSTLIVAMLGGCVDDRYTPDTPSGDEVQLLVELNVPSVSTVATRSLTKSQEERIEKLDVLVFEVNGSTETFAYKTYGVEMSGTENKYKVNLKKSEGGKKYRLVFLANLRAEVDAAITTAFTATTKLKADVLAAITFEAFPEGAPSPWNTTTEPLRYLPMWGESANTYTVEANLHTIPKVSMLRSVARVDILMNPVNSNLNENGFVNDGGFTLTGVRVYNASSRGAAAPVFQEGDLPDVGSTGVTHPSVPSPNPRGMIGYSYSDLAEQLVPGMFRDIYIAESANTNTVNSKTDNIAEAQMTCVVVEITDAANKATWYRLDFVENQTTGLRWDILRNYCYTFKIKSINGQGYESADIAFSRHPVNLEYEMNVSNEITEVVFNGQYMLGVSQREYNNLDEFAHTKESDDNTLLVTTTYPDGWKVDKIVEVTDGGVESDINLATGWLKLIDTNDAGISAGDADATTTVKLCLTENNTYKPRTGYIHLSAGHLTYVVKVDQGTTPYLESSASVGRSNSYIVAPNSPGILIPVDRCNESPLLGPQLVKSEAFTAELVWTDHSKGMASDSNIKTIRAVVGTGSSGLGYVIVVPGSEEGNAVVAIKNASGKVLWSWHIWVTKDTPDVSGSQGFMDRNLGAIGKTPGVVETKGLLYQWGRKDPFPGSNSTTGISESFVYDALGNSSTIKCKLAPSDTDNNLGYAVAHPDEFLQNSGVATGDWYSTTKTKQNDKLWNDATNSTKTVYDPCPVGWRVPLHSTLNLLHNITSNFANYGRTNASYGGFYPAAGYRDTSGEITGVGTDGRYWSASGIILNEATAYETGFGGSMSFTSSATFQSTSNTLVARVAGYSVRCVKYNE